MNKQNLPFKESELVLNPDNSLYHIHLKNEHIAPTVLLVGDPGRVETISGYFDRIEHKISNREFLTHTGWIGASRVTAMATGIGTDNIDIVINELDAAVNIDPKTRLEKEEKRSLQLIRIGTCGALHSDLPVDSFILSEFGLGFDGLLHYYENKQSEEEQKLESEINDHLRWDKNLSRPYIVKSSEQLRNRIGEGMHYGITATATGFYGPQGRQLRLGLRHHDLNEKLQSFRLGNHRITNFEMETSALYSLGKALGHECCTCCIVLANRARQEYSVNYKVAVRKLIEIVLERITSSDINQ